MDGLPWDSGWEDVGEVMSNALDGVPESSEANLRGKKAWGSYPGWEFHGLVWWRYGQFHCQVSRYKTPRGTISADTLPELKQAVSEEFGFD